MILLTQGEGFLYEESVIIAIKMEKLEKDAIIKTTVIGVIVAIGTIIWSAGLAFSNYEKVLFFDTLSFEELIFAGIFLVGLAITIGFISALCHRVEKAIIYMGVLTGVLIGGIISLAIVKFDIGSIFMLVFFFCSTILVVESTFLKKDELKSMPVFRSCLAAAQKGFLIFGFGLFVAVAFSAIQNEEEHLTTLENTIMDIALSGGGNQQIAESYADAIVVSKIQTVEELMFTEQYTALLNSEEIEAVNFVSLMQAMHTTLNSAETKQLVIEQIKAQQESNNQKITFDMLANQVPMLGMIKNNYWLILGIGAFTTFIFIANLLLGFIAGASAAIFVSFIDTFSLAKTEEKAF